MQADATDTSWLIGDQVQWVTHDRVTQRPLASVLTRIRSFESVHRCDGSVRECAILECNRLVPVSQLFAVDYHAEIVSRRDNNGRSEHRRAANATTSETERASSETGRASSETERTVPAARTHRSQPATASASPSAVGAIPSGCSVLAVDFLNLLVRAFHAGKPTDTHAVRSMFQTVANTIRTLRPRTVVFAMDGGHDFRSGLLPEYKAHRPEPEPLLQAQKHLAEQALRLAGFQAIRVVGWEADDVIASIATAHSDAVICSCDKDLLSLTGTARVFHPWGDGGFVRPEDKLGLPAGQVSDYLALCGDTSDGVPGVKGIGPKTALQLLEQYESLEGILAAAITGQIAGAVGQKLRDQREQALTCRQVVGLNHNLPLPGLEPWAPAAGWQQRLQDLRLGAVAAIVESIAPLLSAATPASPRASVGTTAAAPPAAVTAGGEFTVSAADAPEPDAPCRIRRSIAEPPRELHTVSQRFDGPDRGVIWAWEQGRRLAGQSQAECPWKPDSPLHTAWQQGFRGQDLDVLPEVQVAGGSPAVGNAAAGVMAAAKPRSQRVSRSLF